MKQINYEAAIKKLQIQAEKLQERVEFHTKKADEATFYAKQYNDQLQFTRGQIERLKNPKFDKPNVQQDQNHTVITEHELAGK